MCRLDDAEEDVTIAIIDEMFGFSNDPRLRNIKETVFNDSLFYFAVSLGKLAATLRGPNAMDRRGFR